MKQSHLFTSSRPKRTYPVLAAFDLICQVLIGALCFGLGLCALFMVTSTFAPRLFPAIVHFAARLLGM